MICINAAASGLRGTNEFHSMGTPNGAVAFAIEPPGRAGGDSGKRAAATRPERGRVMPGQPFCSE
jgi:hypothetical protein